MPFLDRLNDEEARRASSRVPCWLVEMEHKGSRTHLIALHDKWHMTADRENCRISLLAEQIEGFLSADTWHHNIAA